MGRGLPFFLRCQQSRVRVSHLAAGGSEPAESLQTRAAKAAWTLLACTLRGTFSRSVMCSRRVPDWPGAAKACPSPRQVERVEGPAADHSRLGRPKRSSLA